MALLKIHNPELGGILLHISTIWGIYIIYNPKWGIYVNCMENQDFFNIFWDQKRALKMGYILYIRCFFGYIHKYTPSTSAFFRPRPAASDEKCLGFGGILLDIPLKNKVYTLHIYIYVLRVFDLFQLDNRAKVITAKIYTTLRVKYIEYYYFRIIPKIRWEWSRLKNNKVRQNKSTAHSHVIYFWLQNIKLGLVFKMIKILIIIFIILRLKFSLWKYCRNKQSNKKYEIPLLS